MKKMTAIETLEDIKSLLSQTIGKKLLMQIDDRIIVTNKDTGNSYQVSKEYYNGQISMDQMRRLHDIERKKAKKKAKQIFTKYGLPEDTWPLPR